MAKLIMLCVVTVIVCVTVCYTANRVCNTVDKNCSDNSAEHRELKSGQEILANQIDNTKMVVDDTNKMVRENNRMLTYIYNIVQSQNQDFTKR